MNRAVTLLPESSSASPFTVTALAPQSVSLAVRCNDPGSLVLRSRPKNTSLTLVRRPDRFEWFSALNISVRTCSRTFARRAKFLARLKSSFHIPGANDAGTAFPLTLR